MKGVVFTQFSEMVEGSFGLETLDKIIVKSGASGSYTAIGTYPHTEMVDLVVALSQETSTPIPDLLEAFGKYLFHAFTEMYPVFFENPKGPFDFLSNVQAYIHAEVLKIYPSAQLPTIETEQVSDAQMKVHYNSERSMSDLALGLMKGCMEHFETEAIIEKTETDETGENVVFVITKQ